MMPFVTLLGAKIRRNGRLSAFRAGNLTQKFGETEKTLYFRRIKTR
jgi:hypothetical protein